jgi:hypothetical protein
MDWVPMEARDGLVARCRTARAFADTPLVRLRHAAPVGHGFGVPSPEEVQETWARSRAQLGRGDAGPAVLTDDGFPLPGLPALFSAVAAAPIAPATLLADVASHLVELIEAPAARR